MPDDPAFPCLVISLFWTGSTPPTVKVNTQLSQLPLQPPSKKLLAVVLIVPCHASQKQQVQVYTYAVYWEAAHQHVILEVMCLRTVTLCLPQSQTELTVRHMPALFTCSSFLKGAATHTRLPSVALETGLARRPMGGQGLWHVFLCAWVDQTAVSLLAAWGLGGGGILISSLKEENTLGNNTRIK